MIIRVLQVIAHLGHGGAEQQLSLLARHLPRDEFEMHVCALSCCPTQRRILERADVPVSLVGNRARVSPLRVWELSRHIKRVSPHVVQIWSDATNRNARLAAILARVPSLVANCSSVNGEPQRGSALLENQALRLLDYCTHFNQTPNCGEKTVAARGAASSVETGTADISSVETGYAITLASAGRQVVVPVGVEGGLTRDWSERNALLHEAGIPSGSRVVVTCSDYTPKSRFQDVIWVADLLKVVHDDTHLVLLGDGPLRWRGQRFCQQVEITDRVHLVVDCCQLDRWIAYANCFWEADGREASSSFTMRAMANGVPVIAVDTPANRALLGHGGGLFFQLGHRAGLARQTESLLTDDALARDVSDCARQRVADYLSTNRMVECHAGLFRELAA